MNRKIRELENSIADSLNASDVPMECKRLILENLMLKCEDKANAHIQNELPITEKGDLEDVSKLD